MANLVTPPLETKPAQNSLSLVYRDAHHSLPQKLFQPLNIAIIASAVLHGVIGYGAPALPFLQRPSAPKEVKIMQLTPQEQSRIRRDVQPLPPAVTGVPIPNAPGQGRTVSPGFPGTFPNNPNNFSTVPRGSNFPTYIPEEGTTFAPTNPRYGTFGSGIPQYTVPNNPGTEPRQTVIVPRETPAPNIPVRRSDQFRTAQNFTTSGRSILNSPFARPSPTPTATPTTTATPTATPTPSPSPTGGTPDNTNGVVNLNPSPTPTSNPTPNPTGDGGNPGGNNPGNPNNNNNNGNPGVAPPNPLLAFNPERTELTPDSQNDGFINFLAVGNEQFLEPDKQVKLTLDMKYPPEACGLKLDKPVTAIFGVIIDEAGAIAKGPEMLQSSGYGIFNEVAKAATMAYAGFTPTKAYIVSVPFVYTPEACAGVSSLPASTPETADSNSPAPVFAPSNQTIPPQASTASSNP